MRIEFVDTKNRRQAVRTCPWAAVIVRVEGGYTCYESIVDYLIRQNQI
jgi:hypothetical protein